MSHPLSLAFLTTFDVGPEEAVRIAAACGYHKVGLRLLPAAPGSEPDYPLMTDDAELRRVQAALAETGVAVADLEIVRLRPQMDWDLMARFCERAEALGGQNVLVAGDDPERERLVEGFARFCDMAAGHGLTADLEFMPWTAVRDLSAARDVVEAAGRPNGGVLVDALHLDRAGSTLAEVAALPGHRINYVQFCDGPDPWDRSDQGMIDIARGARLFPGEGGIDLIGLARAIPQGVTISVEVPHRALAAKLDAHARAAMAIEATRGILRAAGRATAGAAA